jgi:cytidyltransferase-like protein|tara:strand:- start:4708 stop:5112 length:405 start_codon:yes stop_codon:yes gene_type:complete
MSKKKRKKIAVDMSATLIHHGHIRLIKKAKKFGKVIVALTKDKEIIKYKGYIPELNYSQRKEIISAIRYVDKVIPSNFFLDEKFLDRHKIKLLIHGNDQNNKIDKKRVVTFKRTKNISSTILRRRSIKCQKKSK